VASVGGVVGGVVGGAIAWSRGASDTVARSESSACGKPAEIKAMAIEETERERAELYERFDAMVRAARGRAETRNDALERRLGVVEHEYTVRKAQVSEVMTADPMTVKPTDPLEACMGLMANRGFRHLPVWDGRRVIGVVSVGDVVKDNIRRMGEQIGFLETYIKGHGV
jgi:CBS domain-containing protein